MSNNKLKLPSSILKPDAESNELEISDSVRIELLKTKRALIDKEAKIEVGKLELAKEGIGLVKSVFDLLKSHKELQATREEWKGRIEVAESAVEQAKIDLEKTREKNKTEIEKLSQSKEALMRLLELFDDVMNSMKNAELSQEERKEARHYLLQLSDKIVQLRK